MEPPQEPDASSCCNSGCNPCIIDVYEAEVKRYERWLIDQHPVLHNCLKPLRYIGFRVAEVIPHTSTANIYVLEHVADECGNCRVRYEPGNHLLMQMQDLTRAYTPIPWQQLAANQFAVLIKLYPSGKMSACIRRLRIGDVTQWRGPYGPQLCLHRHHPDGVLFIAQGTGIAPVWSLIRSVVDDEANETRLRLMYCCRNWHDVHLHDEIYALKSYWNFDYVLFISAKEPEMKTAAKYNEMFHLRRFDRMDVEQLAENGFVIGTVFICGSQLFMDEVSTVLQQGADKKLFKDIVALE